MKLIVKWRGILDLSSGKAIKLSLHILHTGKRHIISAEKDSPWSEKVVMAEVSWILTLIPQSQESIALY